MVTISEHRTGAPELERIVVVTVTASVPGSAKATEAEMVVSTPGRDSLGDRVFPEGVDLHGCVHPPR